MDNIQHYNKAIIAAVVGLIFVGVQQFGVTEQTTLGQVAQMIVSAVAVYLIPNKKA